MRRLLALIVVSTGIFAGPMAGSAAAPSEYRYASEPACRAGAANLERHYYRISQRMNCVKQSGYGRPRGWYLWVYRY